MPTRRANVKNEKQYEALKDKGMSKERAAKIANSPNASKHGGEKSHSGSGDGPQGREGDRSQEVVARPRHRGPLAGSCTPGWPYPEPPDGLDRRDSGKASDDAGTIRPTDRRRRPWVPSSRSSS